MRKFTALFVSLFLVLVGSLELYHKSKLKPGPTMPKPEKIASGYDITPLVSPSPTPKPTLSPQELAAKYGPCITIPILMYHHINTAEVAKNGGYSGLNVTPEMFRSQLQYLKDKSYQVVPITVLNEFFDRSITPPTNSIILTFDDGYADFPDVAAPILSEYNYPATLFVSTGLMENPGYSTWSKLSSLNASLFYLGNHTWSHHNMVTDFKTIDYELGTADTQLNDHGLNLNKIFAYPYGPASNTAINWLDNHDYTLAFTTTNHSYHCKGLRFTLGRIRVGNSSLASYGL